MTRKETLLIQKYELQNELRTLQGEQTIDLLTNSQFNF